ncbi:MAG: carbamoyl-phosphate synthase large subunit [Clostridia bacterium]|nr:carbamoyl-phosphate synthase large subunit [Clostridia bacterium]
MIKQKKIMVIGSGPITIGQGAEFDYSGTQACQVLKSEGHEVVLVNSNPATIMTDKKIADIIYSEPLTVEFLEKIIIKEKPDALLAGMGGQTALNLALSLYDQGILKAHHIEILGTDIKSILMAEDRKLFKQVMETIHQPVLESQTANSLEEVLQITQMIGLPVVVRPAFTLGGTGGGIAESLDELIDIASKGLAFSLNHQVLIEKSIKGWKEIEYEMMRDKKGNVITVCNMENVDPVGIHTGDSIVIAPSQTLSDKEYQLLRKASIDIVNALNIEGGCNVQLALNPNTFEYFVIEVNPRVSRSSSLASKATGYPIAKIATKIALGYCLDEIENDVTGMTTACFEPTLDYCAVKIPKWPFDKFETAQSKLGTTMMATGEVMAIGNNFESALLKGVRSLEIGLYGLSYDTCKQMTLDGLFEKLKEANHERLFIIAELFRRQVGVELLYEITHIDKFFLGKIKGIVQLEHVVKGRLLEFVNPEEIRMLKKKGFSDQEISKLLLASKASDVYNFRKIHQIKPSYKMVDTCGGEFEAQSPYYYATYDQFDEVQVSNHKKIIVVGSGPIRIGQGVEFDYCSVHGVIALKEMGYEAIIINNNPETVSTDYDISDKLYFEPITEEDVMNVIEKENPIGVILQFGGQTAIKLAEYLSQMDVPILGTSFAQIHATEEREIFHQTLKKNEILQPEGLGVTSVLEGMAAAKQLGYPLLIRPSYVIGGLGMSLIYKESTLKKYLEEAFEKNKKHPILMDAYVSGKELEVDVISDGTDILIPGIMEHLEKSGIHSGDSTSIYPAPSISADIKEMIVLYTQKIAAAFELVGLFNVQFILKDDTVFVIEVNPRASRSVPFISKVTDVPMIEIATQVIMGRKLVELAYGVGLYPEKNFYAVKTSVFSMDKIKKAEIALGPEMKSTGEVLTIEKDLNKAFLKGFIAVSGQYPKVGKVLVSLSDLDKSHSLSGLEILMNLGYELYLTKETYAYMKHQILNFKGFEISFSEALGMIENETLEMIYNTPRLGNVEETNGFKLRRAAIERKIMCMTSVDTFKAYTKVLEENLQLDELEVYDLCTLNVTVS